MKDDFIILINPWSGAQIFLSKGEIEEKYEFLPLSDEERYETECLEGFEAMKILIKKFGVKRVSELWFS